MTTGAADSRYALQSATGAFVTTGQTGQFVTGSVVRPSETGIFITTGQTGSFITASQTGAFYPNSNPSGFITGVDLSSYATTSYVTGVSGYLQYQISNFSGSSSTGSYVSLTGNETISGIKNFISRPTVNTTGVLISGDAVDTIHLYGKNDEPFTLNKGQPVYIGGANGANPLIKRASNTGERTSSKTIGLLAQNLNSNDFGYIVSEGILEGFNTSAATAGDPMWLGTTGDIIFGTGNKPYGNNHLVYLGVVLRSQSNNGKVYVKPQNGFEIEELHRVYAQNARTNDTLMYNSGSGSWFARQINTGDVSGISAYALAANTGSFITVSQTGAFAASALTGAFLTTGAADGRYYGLSNGQSISGYAITGFNDAITGMTITGGTTKVITLFQRGGSTVTGSFTDNAGTGGGGGSGASVTISTSPPVSPSAGSLWFNSESGALYIYYDDGNSQQWVAPDNNGIGFNAVTMSASVSGVLSVSNQQISGVDPNADRILFWDDSESKLAHLSVGAGLSISGTVLNTAGAGGATNVWIPASAWIPRTTTGCGVDSRELSTNLQNFDELLFDAGTNEFAQALVIMPNNYNNSTVNARFYWTASTGSGSVIWGMQGLAYSNDDILTGAFGTAQTVTDTLLSINDMHITDATSAITLSGTPAANRPIQFQIYRDAAAGGDTLANDARLLGVEIAYTSI